jgi:tripartite-type tricarboxylate transporter receptor subunit TctC
LRKALKDVGNAMKLPRRKFLHLATGAAALPAFPRVALALDYPTRPVHLIVGFPPGGGADTLARFIGRGLSERLGQSVVIENRPGAGSNLAAEAVVRAPPDGYTLLEVTAANASNVTLYPNLSFNFTRDIRPVASISRTPFAMVVNASFPAKTVPEFIAYAKANPRKINMASSGIGITTHIVGELFVSMAGIEVIHVPYRGGEPAITALLGDQVQVYFSPLPEPLEQIKAGKLRALGVTTANRVEALRDVPVIGEYVPGYEASGWQGIGAPKDTPVEIVDKLNRETNSALANTNVRARLADFANEPMPMTAVEFAKLIADETEKWGKVIRAANIKLE